MFFGKSEITGYGLFIRKPSISGKTCCTLGSTESTNLLMTGPEPFVSSPESNNGFLEVSPGVVTATDLSVIPLTLGT